MAMRLAIHCPYCKRPVPTSPLQLGQPVVCPACRGEFVASPAQMHDELSAAASSRPMPAATTSGAMATVGVSNQPAKTNGDLLPPVRMASPAPVAASASVASATTPAIAPAPAPPGITARFITDTIQPPAIAPDADGSLPTLRLADSPASQTTDSQAKPLPLWLALLLVTVSTCLSALVLMSDPAQGSAAAAKAEARRDLVRFYGNEQIPLQPYQLHLREAQLAHSRRDLDAERDRYRQVLALLRAEGRSPYQGLTGTLRDDEELSRLVSILLSND